MTVETGLPKLIRLAPNEMDVAFILRELGCRVEGRDYTLVERIGNCFYDPGQELRALTAGIFNIQQSITRVLGTTIISTPFV